MGTPSQYISRHPAWDATKPARVRLNRIPHSSPAMTLPTVAPLFSGAARWAARGTICCATVEAAPSSKDATSSRAAVGRERRHDEGDGEHDELDEDQPLALDQIPQRDQQEETRRIAELSRGRDEAGEGCREGPAPSHRASADYNRCWRPPRPAVAAIAKVSVPLIVSLGGAGWVARERVPDMGVSNAEAGGLAFVRKYYCSRGRRFGGNPGGWDGDRQLGRRSGDRWVVSGRAAFGTSRSISCRCRAVPKAALSTDGVPSGFSSSLHSRASLRRGVVARQRTRDCQ